MKLVLIGYMGSGKSTIGKKLADTLGYRFIDFDDYIEVREGLTIPNLFRSKGEIYFRKQESFYLRQILDLENENLILALGGGTPCYGDNMNQILKSNHTLSFFLNVSIPELFERLKNEKQKRPLIAHLNDDQEFLEFIGKHLFERNNYYNQANFKLNTDDRTLDEIVEAIILKLY